MIEQNTSHFLAIEKYWQENKIIQEVINRVKEYESKNIKINRLEVIDSYFSYLVLTSYYSKYPLGKTKGVFKQELINLIEESSRNLNILEIYNRLAKEDKIIAHSRYKKIILELSGDYSVENSNILNLGLIRESRQRGNKVYFSSLVSRRILAQLTPQAISNLKIKKSYYLFNSF